MLYFNLLMLDAKLTNRFNRTLPFLKVVIYMSMYRVAECAQAPIGKSAR
jgi:hypothetical protein